MNRRDFLRASAAASVMFSVLLHIQLLGADSVAAVFCAAPCAGAEDHADWIVSQILGNVAKVKAADPKSVPMAFWDFDGTIIKGDIASGWDDDGNILYPGMAVRTIDAGLNSVYPAEGGSERFFDEDYPRLRLGIGKWLAWPFRAQMYFGRSEKEIESFCRGECEKDFCKWYFSSSVKMLEALEEAGVENYIISASPELFVRGASSTLGIPAERFRGVRVKVSDGRMTTQAVYPLPDLEGKVEILREIVRARHGVAVAAFGNSYSTDAAFMRYVATQPLLPGGVKGVAVMINGLKPVEGYAEHFIKVTQHKTVGGLERRRESFGRVTADMGEDGAVRVSSTDGQAEYAKLSFELPVGSGWKALVQKGSGLKVVNAWLPVGDGHVVPWYVLLNDGKRTYGFGVKVRPHAMCSWRVEPGRVVLLMDVRAGGRPVELGGRILDACEVVRCESKPGESAYETGRRLCALMCPNPRLPKTPMFGFNDWYAAYGRNTATNFLADAAFVVSLCQDAAQGTSQTSQPYVVMDDGWQKFSPPEIERLTGRFDSGYGPWEESSRAFGMDMKTFCSKIAALGAKPGLWYRPLCMEGKMCDPSDPDVVARVKDDIRRFREWGFKLVKVDYLTYDWCGHFKGFDEAGRLIRDERAWKDSSRTTAETIASLYRAIREAAGDDMEILGCNAVNHLCAGLFEASRVGPDTSGRNWEQTKRNGVGAVAFKGMENGTFFAADPDCAGLAEEGAIPWEKNRQWIDLLSRSGMPFFISWRRGLADAAVRDALSAAFGRAAAQRRTAEAIDWFDSTAPSRWKTADGVVEYSW